MARAKRKKTKKKKVKLTPEQKKERRLKKAFQKKIVSSFRFAEFQYLKTDNIHKLFGINAPKKGDVDFVFLYENIILVCEDTIAASKHIKDHMNKTKILYDKIKEDFDNHNYSFLEWLKEKYSDKFSKFNSYENNEYQVKYLYFYKDKMPLEKLQFMDYIKAIDEKKLKYFEQITKILKFSSKNELFRFLDLDISRIGRVSSSESSNKIGTAVISPESVSGLKNIKIVSFLMKAEDLMECGYVLRKDNWEESAELYQRLLIKNKIESIREYLLDNERGFINNVIVSLPSDVKFTKGGQEKKFEEINQIENLKIEIPRKINSIGIIDGQHRIYSHYKSESKEEEKIANLRDKLHILVTGLVYKEGMTKKDKIEFESKLFMEINHNAKTVAQDVLLSIVSLQNPYSIRGMARNLILELNKTELFFDKFEISTLFKSEIKSTSIIKYVLEELMEINEEKESFFKYININNKDVLKDKHHKDFEKVYEEYIKECVKVMTNYFNAVKNNFKEEWKNPKEHKIFSVASMNGFILALKKSFKEIGIKDFKYYDDKIKKLKISFKKGDFTYSASKGWGDFSRKILKECFNIESNE